MSGQDAPAWYDQDTRARFMVPAVGVPAVDRDIGTLLDPVTLDSDSVQAYELLKNRFADSFFGNILSSGVQASRITMLKRRSVFLRGMVSVPFRLAVSSTVYKETDLRVFRIKLSSGGKGCTCRVYLRKQDGQWWFDDVQDIAVLEAILTSDRAERQGRLEWEGWVPHGN